MKFKIKLILLFAITIGQIYGQGVAKAIFYEYEPLHNQIRKTKQIDSQSNEFSYQSETHYDRFIETSITYPFDYSDATSLAMVAKNMIASPITKTIELVLYSSVNNSEISRTPIFYEKTTFNSFGSNVLPSYIEYKIGSGTLRKIVNFVSYDALGNLTSLLELNGKTTVATFYSAIGKQNLVHTITESLGMVSSIDYFPLVGIASEQAPNGLNTSYEYEEFFRLKFIKDHAGDITKAFHYHYKGEAIPSNAGITTLPTTKNFVVSQTPRKKHSTLYTEPDSTATTIQYFNDLGQSIQNITFKGSPDKTKDIVNNATIYNEFGQEWKSILTTPSSSNTGDYEANPETEAGTFYGDVWAYQENIFEKSPLNRLSQQFNAGLDLRGTTPTPKNYIYETAGTDIPLYTISGNSIIKGSASYPANSLFKTSSLDEVGNETIEIKDIEGKLIQSSTKLEAGIYATTHYIYNDLNQLKAIIQPEGYPLTADLAHTADHIFFYNYDDFGRKIEVKIPAADVEYFVYDRWDRPVLSQTGAQRADNKNKWTFTKYDALNRPILMGEMVTTTSHTQLQIDAMADADHHEAFDENAGPIYYGYSSTFPTLNLATDVIYHINFYDAYGNWATGLGFLSGEIPHTQANAKGMITGSKVLNQITANTWLRTAMYYDYKGRKIQIQQEQHLATQPDITSLEYNFAGEVLQKKYKHKKPGDVLLKEIHSNTLDHLGRVLINNHSIDDKPTNMANYVYDNISRLKTKLISSQNGGETKTVGDWSAPSIWLNGQLPATNSFVKIKHNVNIPNGFKAYASSIEEYTGATLTMGSNSYLYLNPTASPNPLQKIDFDYHVRGGLLGVNLNGGSPSTALENDLFSYKLDYQEDNNIQKQSWKNSNSTEDRSWEYTYNGSSWLTSATYAPSGAYSLSGLTFDKNGNIKTLVRNGIDDLKYDYTGTGNRLNYVEDVAANVAGFKDNTSGGTGQDYTYWDDGSLKSDRNKGIYQINYDTFLKKVKKICFNSTCSDWLEFYYAGDGTLIRRESSVANNKWDYTEGLIYNNEAPYQMNTAEGRAVYNGSDWEYEFEYRDIWGNLRQSFKNNGGAPAPLQSADFDMLGIEYNKTSIPLGNFYKFQKQERIEDFGLDIDFFKYRMSDSQIGRLWGVDPLASKYPYNSVYALQENKFGLGVELEGLEYEPFVQATYARQQIERNKQSMTPAQAQKYEKNGNATAIKFLGSALTAGLAVATLPKLLIQGAALGAGVNGGSTALKGGTKDETINATLAGGASGLLTGGGQLLASTLSKTLINSVVTNTATGYLAGGTENAIEQKLNTGNINTGDVIRSATIGAFMNNLGSALGGFLENQTNKLILKLGLNNTGKEAVNQTVKVSTDGVINEVDDYSKSKVNKNN